MPVNLAMASPEYMLQTMLALIVDLKYLTQLVVLKEYMYVQYLASIQLIIDSSEN
jgi:hypothetical protein